MPGGKRKHFVGFGLSTETARKLQHVVDALGRKTTTELLAGGATVHGLYRAVTGEDLLPTWVSIAISMQVSVNAAKKKGTWTQEDKTRAVLIASWLVDQGMG